jgi:hypothetical protein
MRCSQNWHGIQTPPTPFGSPFDVEVPPVQAIYFLHKEGRIEYVGKSKNLYSRLGGMNAGRHHALQDGDTVSWIAFEDDEVLEFVECYYIWLCRPGRNFGRGEDVWSRRMAAKKAHAAMFG